MTAAPLIDVLEQIVQLLRQCGQSEKAAWLTERKLILEHSDLTADAREHVSNELHGVVLGMGGLMDLSLTPVPESSYTSASAREQLDSLGDALYELTR